MMLKEIWLLGKVLYILRTYVKFSPSMNFLMVDENLLVAKMFSTLIMFTSICPCIINILILSTGRAMGKIVAISKNLVKIQCCIAFIMIMQV